MVEDDLSLAEVITDYLHFEGYWPEHFVSGDDALANFRKVEPHLIILDVMLPGMSGFEVMQKIRKESEVPIVMVSAKSDDYNMMKGYDLGADDYMSKPFRPKILMAKVNALINRCYPNQITSQQIKIHELTFNDSQVKTLFNEVDLLLTPKEYELFRLLALNEGHIFTYENLINQIDDGESQLTQNAISAHVKNIRKKLKKYEANFESIRTIWGVGYRFDWSAKG